MTCSDSSRCSAWNVMMFQQLTLLAWAIRRGSLQVPRNAGAALAFLCTGPVARDGFVAAETCRGACSARRLRTNQPSVRRRLGPYFGIDTETVFGKPGCSGNATSTANPHRVAYQPSRISAGALRTGGQHGQHQEDVAGIEACITVQRLPSVPTAADKGQGLETTRKRSQAPDRGSSSACARRHPVRGCAVGCEQRGPGHPQWVHYRSAPARRACLKAPCRGHMLPSAGAAEPALSCAGSTSSSPWRNTPSRARLQSTASSSFNVLETPWTSAATLLGASWHDRQVPAVSGHLVQLDQSHPAVVSAALVVGRRTGEATI